MIVSNTSPIINLACIGRLGLLPDLYGDIVVPPAVFSEITAVLPDAPGAADVRTATWIKQQSIVNRPLVAALRLGLDAGEAEAIACALQVKAKLLLIDERRGRRAAQELGLPVMGLMGVLLVAKNRGMVSSLRPILDDLRHIAGFWLSDALYGRILQDAGESP